MCSITSAKTSLFNHLLYKFTHLMSRNKLLNPRTLYQRMLKIEFFQDDIWPKFNYKRHLEQKLPLEAASLFLTFFMNSSSQLNCK